MAYNKTTWVDGSVPVDAEHMNNIEDGIESATEDAANAQATAEDAQSAADKAQSTAEDAQSAADKAQSTADEASTAASNAQESADKAQTSADDAQAAAEEAQKTADSASEAVESEAAERKSADDDLSDKIQENSDLIEGLYSKSDFLAYEFSTDSPVHEQFDILGSYSYFVLGHVSSYNQSATDMPSTTASYYIIGIASGTTSGNYKKLIAIPENTSTTIYYRTKSAGTWSNWTS